MVCKGCEKLPVFQALEVALECGGGSGSSSAPCSGGRRDLMRIFRSRGAGVRAALGRATGPDCSPLLGGGGAACPRVGSAEGEGSVRLPPLSPGTLQSDAWAPEWERVEKQALGLQCF